MPLSASWCLCCTWEFPACFFIYQLLIFVDCRVHLCRIISVWPSFTIYTEILCFTRISLYLGLYVVITMWLSFQTVLFCFTKSNFILRSLTPLFHSFLWLFLLSSHSLMWVINEALVGRPSSPYVSGVSRQHVSHTLSVSHSVIHTLVAF